MIYSFECECEEQFEKTMTLAEFEEFKEKEREVKCPACGSTKVENYINGSCNFVRFWDKL
jgi:hypothetical protein